MVGALVYVGALLLMRDEFMKEMISNNKPMRDILEIKDNFPSIKGLRAICYGAI